MGERIRIKRIFEPPLPEDGFRVLVDRLWPRGLPKESARIDLWLKEIAPGHDLRKWFGHDPEKWEEFQRRYFRELDQRPEAVEQLLQKTREGTMTLLYAARDPEFNNARALKTYLEKKLNESETNAGRASR
ncbi:MAG: DUF488 domain-containing protein [Calditrichaeota bacterium]|nr:MAG: DUF488 domain-containing protein [Calditrichota bacterium]